MIENKAILAIENYLENSALIDSKINSNDKEMSWDGHLYVYGEEDAAKDSYLCRIPVQVKGKVVDACKKDFSYPVEAADLRAYLTEGILYFVIQLAPDGKYIFYRDLYPLTIRRILNGHRNQKTISVKMRQLSMSLSEFEQFLVQFNTDCKKQVSAVIGNAEPLKLEDLQNQVVRKFSFNAPRNDDQLSLFSYLSTHPTFIYGELRQGVEWPIGEDPVTFNFSKYVDKPVRVAGRTFYDGFQMDIIDGKLNIEVGGLTMVYDIQEKNLCKTVHFRSQAKTLKSFIREGEFVIALNEHNVMELGGTRFELIPNGSETIGYYENMLPHWLEFERALNKIGYMGDLPVDNLSDSESRTISILIDTLLKGVYYDLKDLKAGLVNLELLGLNLLVWVARKDDGKCLIGNAFDGSLELRCRYGENEYAPVTIYSFLSKSGLWETCDNIDYGGMIAAYDKLPKDNRLVFEIANLDVLEIIKAADRLDEDSDRRNYLLDAAYRLVQWVSRSDSAEDFRWVYSVNAMQIHKRQGDLSSDEREELGRCLLDSGIAPYVKCGAALLLENYEMFDVLYSGLSQEDRSNFDSQPIIHFRKTELGLQITD